MDERICIYHEMYIYLEKYFGTFLLVLILMHEITYSHISHTQNEYFIYKMHFVIQTDPVIHELKQVTRPRLAIGHSRRNGPVANSD